MTSVPKVRREDIDVDHFISLVKSRESIWNFKSADYNNKTLRCQHWKEVCQATVPDFPSRSDSEMEEIEAELQAKWKVLRDCFTRSLRNKTRMAAAGGVVKPYRYHNQLSFLKIMGKTRKKKFNFQTPTSPEPIKCAKQTTETRKEEDLLETITRNVMNNISNENNDEDRQFLLCLLSDMKRIPMEFKLDAKSDILNVIRHYTRKTSYMDDHVGYANAPDPLVVMATMSDEDSDKEIKLEFAN